jgi:hypothetical protein
MKLVRYKDDSEKQAIINNLGPWDESKAWYTTDRMREKYNYPFPKPKFVRVQAATYMLDTDHVVGISHNGESKAYPMWILDYHHHLNDVVGGEPVVYST